MPERLSKVPISTFVKRLRILPDGFLGLTLLLAISVFLYGLTLFKSYPQWSSVVVLGSAILIIGLGVTFFFKEPTRMNVAVLLLSSIISLFALNVFLKYYDHSSEGEPQYIAGKHTEARTKAAARTRVELDTRSEREVVNALRAQGRDAYGGSQASYLGIGINQADSPDALLPLGDISLADIVWCNEAGPWVIFESDRYGFNNDDAIYKKDSHRILILGDSFAQGVCVEPEDNVAGWLGRQGYDTINLGVAGSGPLAELGRLREYGSHLSPQIVLWLYFKNDLTDLSEELRHPGLSRYMEPNYSQDLINRQEEIDHLSIAHLKRRNYTDYTEGSSGPEKEDGHEGSTLNERPQTDAKVTIEEGDKSFSGGDWRERLRTVKAMLTLYELRLLMGATAWKYDLEQRQLDTGRMQRFSSVLELARDETAGFGGDLYFVYLPGFLDFSSGPKESRGAVIATVNALQIPLIDFYPRLSAYKDPLSFFPFRLNGHYTAEGYKQLAELIIKEVF